ncbi:MHF histone-fold complex component [Rhizina undulata]
MPEPQIDEALRERLKSALWYSIGKIVDEESLSLELNATPQFIGALTEMVWAQLENVARDLESFARHAGRSTVNTEDVLLLARRNEGLGEVLREFVEDEARGKGKGKAKGGK